MASGLIEKARQYSRESAKPKKVSEDFPEQPLSLKQRARIALKAMHLEEELDEVPHDVTPQEPVSRKKRPIEQEGETTSGDKTQQKKSKKTKLSYRAHEIIPRNSPYSFNFRSLLNAERFVSEKEFQMALDIYQRLMNKIPSRSITDKIRQNIEDIEDIIEQEEEEPQPVMIQLVGSIPPVSVAPQPTTPPGTSEPQQPGALPFGADLTGLSQKKQQRTDDGSLESLANGLLEISKAIFQGRDIEIKAEKEINIIQGEKPSGGSGEAGEEEASGGGGPESAKPKVSDESEKESTGKKSSEADESTPAGAAEEPPSEPGMSEPPSGASSEGGAGTQEGASESAETESGTREAGGTEDASQAEESPASNPESTGVLEEPEGLEPFDEESDEDTDDFEEEKPPVQEIRGVLELKTPDQEDTPFLTLTYDFSKIPHVFALSKDHNILEYAYYKYKPMLVKAQRFIRRKQITKALNYYRTIREQQIPDEFREMIDRNIKDITEYIQKYLMTRQEVS